MCREKIHEAGRWLAFFPRHVAALVTSFPICFAHAEELTTKTQRHEAILRFVSWCLGGSIPRMNSQTRRSFIKLAGATSFALADVPRLHAAPETPTPKVKLGIASYSYWHFRDPKV